MDFYLYYTLDPDLHHHNADPKHQFIVQTSNPKMTWIDHKIKQKSQPAKKVICCASTLKKAFFPKTIGKY